MASAGSVTNAARDTPPLIVRTDEDKSPVAEETTASEEPQSNAITETGQKPAPPNQLRLTDLPNELINHIIDHLDTECPSEVNWNKRPDTTLTHSTTVDLKTISRTSTHLRHLVLPRLFAHARLEPTQSTPFLTFVERNKLANHIISLVAHLPGPCTHLYPAWWSRLLTIIPLTTFTILCPPYVFAELAHISLVNTDSWVFNMPYHTVSNPNSKLNCNL